MATDDRQDRGTVYMTRNGAAVYLSDRLGRPVSPVSMRRWAIEGRGPRFVTIFGRASYTQPWLDEWLASPDAERRPGGYRPRKSD